MYSASYESAANSEQIKGRDQKAISTLTGEIKKSPDLKISKRTSMPNQSREKTGNSRISAKEDKKKKRRPAPENQYCDQADEDRELIEMRQE